jgi:acetyltransferase-like isoleucine patch superfamily enzyme
MPTTSQSRGPINRLLKQDDLILFLAKTAYARLYIPNSYVHAHASIKGYRNILVNGELKIGLQAPGFVHKSEKTYVYVRGKLQVSGKVSIGQGCRIDVDEGGVCILDGCNFNGASDFVVRHKLSIGEGTTISWGCQILDSDWHTLQYAGKKEHDPAIAIGKHVWIGSRVLINKGVQLGDGCVVGSGSVVTRSFPAGVLIAGNPARIIRENVEWF